MFPERPTFESWRFTKLTGRPHDGSNRRCVIQNSDLVCEKDSCIRIVIAILDGECKKEMVGRVSEVDPMPVLLGRARGQTTRKGHDGLRRQFELATFPP